MSISILSKIWPQLSFVAFDTETSGPYPIGDDIVEVGLVRWENGQEIASYNQLIKPRKPMGQEVIGIHGITNEMVANSPSIKDVIGEVSNFIGDSIIIAHHAPFDLGFLVYDLEKHGLKLSSNPALCSSLLARKLIKGSDNHKLQTLIKFLKIEAGPAHRAESDARACLQVALNCFAKMGEASTLADLQKAQGKELYWRHYSISDIRGNADLRGLVESLERDRDVEFVYMSGSHKGKTRRVKPLGLVRNPDGDYLSGVCLIDNTKKRFYLNAIKDSLACP